MKNEDKIVELLAEMLQRHDTMIERLTKLETQQANTNLAIGELRLSVMKLADKLEMVVDHEKRIGALEHKVFH